MAFISIALIVMSIILLLNLMM